MMGASTASGMMGGGGGGALGKAKIVPQNGHFPCIPAYWSATLKALPQAGFGQFAVIGMDDLHGSRKFMQMPVGQDDMRTGRKEATKKIAQGQLIFQRIPKETIATAVGRRPFL
jgi:hypothetical protein